MIKVINRAGIEIRILQQTQEFYLASTRGAKGVEFYEYGNILTLPGGVIYKTLSCGSYIDCKRRFDTESKVQQFITKAKLKKSEYDRSI